MSPLGGTFAPLLSFLANRSRARPYILGKDGRFGTVFTMPNRSGKRVKLKRVNYAIKKHQEDIRYLDSRIKELDTQLEPVLDPPADDAFPPTPPRSPEVPAPQDPEDDVFKVPTGPAPKRRKPAIIESRILTPAEVVQEIRLRKVPFDENRWHFEELLKLESHILEVEKEITIMDAIAKPSLEFMEEP